MNAKTTHVAFGHGQNKSTDDVWRRRGWQPRGKLISANKRWAYHGDDCRLLGAGKSERILKIMAAPNTTEVMTTKEWNTRARPTAAIERATARNPGDEGQMKVPCGIRERRLCRYASARPVDIAATPSRPPPCAPDTMQMEPTTASRTSRFHPFALTACAKSSLMLQRLGATIPRVAVLGIGINANISVDAHGLAGPCTLSVRDLVLYKLGPSSSPLPEPPF